MASGYCVSVLLLSLLAFSKHAGALRYRSSPSSGIKPYFKMAEGFPHSYQSASRYESSAQPESSLSIYGASHGSYINGYLQHGGYSSYRPGSMSSSRPRQPHKQSHYQVKTDGALQSKDAMWDFALPQKGNRLEAGIVSSYAIEMHSEPQQPSNDALPQPDPKHQQPLYKDCKPRPQPVQQQHYETIKPPSAGELQTKAGMWDLAINSNARSRSLMPGSHYRQPHQLAPFYNRYQL